MDALMSEIFSTIIPSAPYLIAAYALLILALFAFVFLLYRSIKKTEAKLEALEDELRSRD